MLTLLTLAYLCVLFVCQLDSDHNKMTFCFPSGWNIWADDGERPHADQRCIRRVQRQEPQHRVSAPPRLHPGNTQRSGTVISDMLYLCMKLSYESFTHLLRVLSCRWEGAGGAGRLRLPSSELRAGRPEEGEALRSDPIVPVHQHQHPLTSGQPLPGQHLGEPLAQEDLLWYVWVEPQL